MTKKFNAEEEPSAAPATTTTTTTTTTRDRSVYDGAKTFPAIGAEEAQKKKLRRRWIIHNHSTKQRKSEEKKNAHTRTPTHTHTHNLRRKYRIFYESELR